ncbi:MAG: pectate lyase [Bacteroidetes bacterium]|nr:pectate lyase [Bacteroidota bacterium]
MKFIYAFVAGVFLFGPVTAQKKPRAPEPPSPVAARGGHLVYVPDDRGNQVPDFSYSGYMGGDSVIPTARVRVVIRPMDGDATFAIQQALDYVGGLPPDAHGLRGAVLLGRGTYSVSGGLVIRSSGVVLRGSGMGEDGTVLVAAGTDRRTLIRVAGVADRVVGKEVDVTDGYVPVGSRVLHVGGRGSGVEAGGGFRVGATVLVRRPSTEGWIRSLGMETFGGGISALGWKAGQRDIYWDRRVVAVNGDALTLDAPITTALDTAYGGGKVAAYRWDGRISQVGVENLRLRSAYDHRNPKDEAHSWMAITLENVSDAWVRQVIAEHFAGSAVDVLETANRVTVEDCKFLAPVSEIGGQRRNAFITTGGQTLMQRLYSERAFHDFAVGFCAPGPNAFVQCQSYYPYGMSGAIDSWASGVLFDVVNVDGQVLGFENREQDGQGAGWCAANSLFWNCTAARINCYRPPGAQNWSYGSWAQFGGDGYWNESNAVIQPRSFYYTQLVERLAQASSVAAERVREDVMKRAQLLPMETEASSSPTVAQAAALIALSKKPRVQMTEWIDQAAQRNPISVEVGAGVVARVPVHKEKMVLKAAPMKVVNGWLTRGGVLVGRRYYEPWWMGNVRPYGIAEAKPAVTRWVPGRTGTGLTDDLMGLTDEMKAKHVVALDHNYGLWYDRRRDDHERIRRIDGDVWPPYYELPFARSGKDTAWDGLSKYDLTKYNSWYWSRLRSFADLSDLKGLVLIHQNYFQHNIIEAGAHYADFPWRPANNINNTGFPEPPPFAGDKRIFMAEQFYDTAHPVRKALHRAFIRQCLDNFSGNSGVIQELAAEFTGPLHFVDFWLDNIRSWEKEKGIKEIIGLSTTKDVQDAILKDPLRGQVVDVIDIRYWYYQEDGKVYAPLGGQSLAPRQHERLLKPKRPSFEQVYRAVSEYRRAYPAKAVMYSAEGCDNFGWAVFMGGGSLANIPVEDGKFLTAAAGMAPVDLPGSPKGVWALGDKKGDFIVYVAAGVEEPKLEGTVQRIDPGNGAKVLWIEK